METKDVGKRFVLWGSLFNKKKSKVVFRQETWEYDPPYRYSNALVIRLWRWGLMLGKWEDSPASGVSEHLVRAINPALDVDYIRRNMGILEPVSGPDCDPWL
jgi:hypothetical protein